MGNEGKHGAYIRKARANEYKRASGDWSALFDSDDPSETAVWSVADPATIVDTIDAVTAMDGMIGFGRTRDGTGLQFTVWHSGAKRTLVGMDKESVENQLIKVMALFQKMAQPVVKAEVAPQAPDPVPQGRDQEIREMIASAIEADRAARKRPVKNTLPE